MTNKSIRGFAAMDPEKQRAIASKGGKAAHAKGTAHRFTAEEASEAGRKGGRAAHARGTAHRFTAEEASQAGRKGGSSRSATVRQHREAGADMPRETDMMPGGSPGRHAPAMPPGEQPERENEQNASRQPLPATQPAATPQSSVS